MSIKDKVGDALMLGASLSVLGFFGIVILAILVICFRVIASIF